MIKKQMDLFLEVGAQMGAVESWARKSGHSHLIGVDEAGRGPLAGPVVAAAIWLNPSCLSTMNWLEEVSDSKMISSGKRERLFRAIMSEENTLISAVYQVDATEIDKTDILKASLRAMRESVKRVAEQSKGISPLVVVDGNQQIPGLELAQQTFVKGDARSLHIASASILAKVTRDRIMEEYDRKWPEYGFSRHKGYPTAAHREALHRHGPCPCHRMTFRGVQIKAR